VPPELCGGANASQAYGTLGAWGWADWNCTGTFGYMCKMLREWRPLLLPCADVALSMLHCSAWATVGSAAEACDALS
jgi:hypothetical protein